MPDGRAGDVLVVALTLAIIGLAGWCLLLTRWLAVLRRKLRRLLVAGSDGGLDRLAADLERVDHLSERIDALNALHRGLEESGQRALQRVGVVRFNPFTDAGGDQSFAVALLDALGNGVVVSSLHGRSDTRVFAKPVRAGRSRHALSSEEEEAIRQALAPAAS